MKRKYKAIAFLLTAVMSISMITISTFADEAETKNNEQDSISMDDILLSDASSTDDYNAEESESNIDDIIIESEEFETSTTGLINESEEDVTEKAVYYDETGLLNTENPSDSNILYSGMCGDNLQWELDSMGTLTISGTGDMYDYRIASEKRKGSYSLGDPVPWMFSDGTSGEWIADKIKRIIIEEGVTGIGSGAFTQAGAEDQKTEGFVEYIKVPSTLIRIGCMPFAYTGCDEFIMPDSVSSLDSYVIDANGNKVRRAEWTFKCSLFKKVTWGRGVQLPIEGFENSSVETVILQDNITDIPVEAFLNCKSLTNVQMPNSIKTIQWEAFCGCEKLTEIYLPEGLISIGGYVFEGTAIKKLLLPSTITSLKDENGTAFHSFSTLEEIDFRDTEIDNLPNQLFSNCENLKTVYLPSTLKTIGSNAFERCKSLKSIVLPESIETIDSGAFLLAGIESIIIPKTCNKIHTNYSSGKIVEQPSFYGCTSLTDIVVDKDNATYCSRDGVLYNKDKTQLLYCPEGKMELEIPSSVVSINETAFRGIDMAEENGTSPITKITFYGNAPEIPESTFRGLITTVYYPANNQTWTSEIMKDYGGTIKWVPYINAVTITFNANGGTVSPSSKSVNKGEKYGDLPVPTRTNYTFDGWYTSATGGTRITSDTVVNLTSDQTLYAHWASPKNIDDSCCTVNLSQDSYIFDGKSKQPTVTVKYNSTTLIRGTDYTISYSDNTNAGVATVVIRGTGNYSGTCKKTFTIAQASPTLKFAVSSVSKKVTDSAFINKLSITTDGTIRYSSSNSSVAIVNSSTGQVTIKGEGTATITASAAAGKNYKAGKVSFTLTVTGAFQWGADNWNFNNSASQGYFYSNRYIDQINSTYLTRLKNNLKNSEYRAIFSTYDGWIYDQWGGSCYGMSSLEHLSKNRLFPYGQYKSGATSLYQLSCPKTDGAVSSLITYYQMLQVKGVIQNQYRTVPVKSNKENIEKIISLLNSNDTVLIGFQKAGWGGHAILAYDYEYGSYSWNNVTYQGCIKICDPNASKGYNNSYNIYFNSKTFNWTIPGYSSITSANGARFNYVGADINEINEGGYLTGTNDKMEEDFVARINAAAIADNRTIVKVRESNGSYLTQNNSADDIIEDYAYVLGGKQDGVIGYNLYDSSAAYKVSQSSPQKLQLTMDYGTCYLEAESAAGNFAIFDKKGYVEVDGDSANYRLAMTFNEGYPTDWFTVQVSGAGGNNVSLLKSSEGYIVSSTDNLKNVKVEANNRDKTVTGSFSTTETTACICQKSDGTLNVLIDKDHNGTYETPVTANKEIWKRLSGNGRYDTMQAIVKEGFSKTGGTVIIATGTGFKDALAAAGLAGLYDAPIILTDGKNLSSQAREELIRLKPQTIYIAGGTFAISDNVKNQIKTATNRTPVRLAGNNSSETSAKLALEGKGKWSATAVIATNKTFKDALSVAPLAYANKMPILLADNGQSVSSSVLKALKDCGIKNVIIVGGTAAVSKNAENQLTAAGFNIRERLWGNNGVATSAAIAKYGIEELGMNANQMGVATSQNFPDALAGAALCGHNKAVLILADDKATANASFPSAYKNNISKGYIFGGIGAVGEKTVNMLNDALK